MTELHIDLNTPGMTHYHRAGLAGLYMALENLDAERYRPHGGWILSPTSVTLHWEDKPKPLITHIVEDSLCISDGMVDFATHRGVVDQTKRYEMGRIISATLWQHGKSKAFSKTDWLTLPLEYNGQTIERTFRPMLSYRTQNTDKMFDRHGNLVNTVQEILGYHYPGGSARHGGTRTWEKLTDTPARFLCLLFAPMALAYFYMQKRRKDGTIDPTRQHVVVVPEFDQLDVYAEAYRNYLQMPLNNLFVAGLGEAAFVTLLSLNVRDDVLVQTGSDACTVMCYGKTGFRGANQTPRSDVLEVRVDDPRLTLFKDWWRLLAPKLEVYKNEDKKKKSEWSYRVFRSDFRAFVADNIAADRTWLSGFTQFLRNSGTNAEGENYGFMDIRRRREDIMDIIQKDTQWHDIRHKYFILAFQKGLNMHYGHESEMCHREGRDFYKKMQSENRKIMHLLMRQTTDDGIRSAILRYMGKHNPVYAEHAVAVNSFLFNPDNSFLARDLALAALASYKGGNGENTNNENMKE